MAASGISQEPLIWHILCDAHGSYEEGSDKPFNLPESVCVVQYAPPGAALAEGLADYVYKECLKSASLGAFLKDLKPQLHLVPRPRKGVSPTAIPPKVDFPIVWFPGKAIPDLTLTGDDTLSGSGVFRTRKGRTAKPVEIEHLHKDKQIQLSQVIAYYCKQEKDGDFFIVHWCSCASDHTQKQEHKDASGFKVQL